MWFEEESLFPDFGCVLQVSPGVVIGHDSQFHQECSVDEDEEDGEDEEVGERGFQNVDFRFQIYLHPPVTR
ncbi:hypothetical protein GCM10026987_33800 [Belliella aquatica]|uniref:Uncharacterized protein n=1 Tax=Belliella aquatica TaxID=1323734 RepID=A0ABQ1LZB4_9BACT|nr:hypothetical protein GCM10010993_08350 [Belliella aquatica]